MWNPFARKREPRQFWDWFVSNRTALDDLPGIQTPPAKIDFAELERRTEPLLRELRRYDPRLAFEIGGRPEDAELVISAEGNSAAFDSVFALVAAAPKIPGWTIVPLKPRTPNVYVTLNVGDRQISTGDFRFVHAPAEDGSNRVDLIWLTSTKRRLQTISKLCKGQAI